MADQRIIITDTSVLINFLVLDKVGVLASLPGKRLLVTDHVRSEVTDHYSEQLQGLEVAFAFQQLEEISVTDLPEVQLFAQLTGTGLGIGECSAIAVAAHRGCAVAIDDKTAIKRIAKLFPSMTVETTESLVINLIRAQILSVANADAMKSDWEQNYRFRLPFKSFGERLV